MLSYFLNTSNAHPTQGLKYSCQAQCRCNLCSWLLGQDSRWLHQLLEEVRWVSLQAVPFPCFSGSCSHHAPERLTCSAGPVLLIHRLQGCPTQCLGQTCPTSRRALKFVFSESCVPGAPTLSSSGSGSPCIPSLFLFF